MDEQAAVTIREIVVVEGLHDKQAVDVAVNADVWIVGGDRISHRLLAELKRASQHRGLIVLTDPDGPGERIRRRIATVIPAARHAFVSRALATSAHGIGVEHADPSVIRRALTASRGPLSTAGKGAPPPDSGLPSVLFTLDDLRAWGLAGCPQAAQRRQTVGDALCIGYANAKSFLHKLNALGVHRDEWLAAVQALDAQAGVSRRIHDEREV